MIVVTNYRFDTQVVLPVEDAVPLVMDSVA